MDIQQTPPPQQIHQNEQCRRCLFCPDIVDLNEHLPNCPGLSPDLTQFRPTFIRIQGMGCLCRRCWKFYEELNQWPSHRKSSACRKNKTISNQRVRSLPDRVRPESLKPSVIDMNASEGHHLKQYMGNELETDKSCTELTKDMLRIVQSILIPLLKQWTNKHQHVPSNVLVVYLTAEVVRFGTDFLNKAVVIPTWQTIRKKGGKAVDWMGFLQLPQNLFNSSFIDSKLQKMVSIRKQLRTIRGLNRLALAFPQFLKKRQLPKVNRQHRETEMVNLRDLVSMLHCMMSTRKKKMVHLALDLNIILLCSQRYLADRTAIQNGILNLLNLNSGRTPENLILTFPMKIGKTNVKQEVVLSRQLVLMLLELNWQGWNSKTERLVRRMREWLGIYGYSLKRAVMEAVTEFANDLSVAQRLAGHRSIRNTRIYTPGSQFRDILRIVNELVIPDLNSRFGEYDKAEVMENLNRLVVPHLRYQQFTANWVEKLKERLYGWNFQVNFRDDETVDFMKQAVGEDRDGVEQNELNQEAIALRRHEELIRNAGSQQEAENIDFEEVFQDLHDSNNKLLIYGVYLDFIRGRFQQKDFMQQIIGYQNLACALCPQLIASGHIRLKCVYCEIDYHPSCAPLICNCTKSSANIQYYPLIPLQALQLISSSKQKVIMPPQYFHNTICQAEQTIRTLFAVRRFRYTRIAVLSPGYLINFPPNYWQQVSKLDLPNYKDYIDGKYFPPLQAKPVTGYRDHIVWGSQWGLFANEDIESNVLLGQYACDILQGRDLVLCKKSDSIFRYSGGSGRDDCYLAPKDYAGYVMLINTAPKKDCNCYPLRAIVSNCLRILVFSSRRIRKGEQLAYDYGSDYKYRENLQN